MKEAAQTLQQQKLNEHLQVTSRKLNSVLKQGKESYKTCISSVDLNIIDCISRETVPNQLL